MPRRALTAAVDVCLIIAALAGIWTMWEFHRRETRLAGQNDPRAGMIGMTLKNVDVNWNRSGSESAPFYQRLIASVGRRVQVAALFTHDVATAKLYLDRLGLGVSVIRGSVSFPWPVMTPTLMLCDATGKITRVWIGKLTMAEESEVLSAVAAANPSQRSCITVGADELLHSPVTLTRWPKAVSCSTVARAIRPSRFNFPGTNS
jgi:hypothetical protein